MARSPVNDQVRGTLYRKRDNRLVKASKGNFSALNMDRGTGINRVSKRKNVSN